MNDERNNAEIERILDSVDKGVSEVQFDEGGILTKIYRKFLLLENVDRLKWNNCLNAYSRAKQGRHPEMISIKGNTIKLLSKPSFTWRNFITAMQVLQTVKLRIVIERTDIHGTTTTIEEVIYVPTDPKDMPAEVEENESNETSS